MATSSEIESLYSDFPRLKSSGLKPTSPSTERYNCIAFVVGDTRRNWWPQQRRAYWPSDCPQDETVDAFVAMFETFGYERSDSGDFEKGVEKIAIYAIGGIVTHAAYQPTSRGGIWRSKSGTNIDYEHALDALAGELYGQVVCFMRRDSSRRHRRAKHAKGQRKTIRRRG